MAAAKKIGITSTVPAEVILAAGKTPVDLNNVFIGGADAAAMVAAAEARGFPGNVCAWIKGVYTAASRAGTRAVIGVTRGDCSSTEKLLEIWRHEGIETIPFAYPQAPDPAQMLAAVSGLARALGTDLTASEKVRRELKPLRGLLRDLDEMSYQEGKITGAENHLWLVSSSDFNSDPRGFRAGLEAFLARARAREPVRSFVRLGLMGVPPIVSGLHEFIEARGGRVVFNEVPREFAMLGDYPDLAHQYSAYTYPYDTLGRVAAVKSEIRRRSLDAIIHYAQTFCHRQLEPIILRDTLPVPLLTIEADKPGPLDPRTQTRIEAFLEQLRG